MDLGFDLPPRNTDPSFAPVPPEVSIESISVKGEVKIKFSKPVFTFDKLASRTIGNVRRSLKKGGGGGKGGGGKSGKSKS